MDRNYHNYYNYWTQQNYNNYNNFCQPKPTHSKIMIIIIISVHKTLRSFLSTFIY